MTPAYRGNLCRLFVVILVFYLLIVAITLATSSNPSVQQLYQTKINTDAYLKLSSTRLVHSAHLRSYQYPNDVDSHNGIREKEVNANSVTLSSYVDVDKRNDESRFIRRNRTLNDKLKKEVNAHSVTSFSYVDVNKRNDESRFTRRNRTSYVSHPYVNTNATDKTSRDTLTLPYLNVNVSDDGCGDVTFNENISLVEDWLPVDSHYAVYVYSAYHDYSTPNAITVTSISIRHQPIICQFWYRPSGAVTVSLQHVNGFVELLPEGHDRRFVSSIIKCPHRNQTIPTYVSIVTERCQTPKNVLRLREISKNRSVRNFTVCVTPLNFRYSKMHELIEWIELNRILGAERFVFYNFSTSATIDQVLNYYERLNLVEVLRWSLPVNVDVWPPVRGHTSHIHYFGQLVALKECLLRSKQHSVYVVNEDLDEFIIPYGANVTDWDQMLQKMPNEAWYSFRNVFFRKEWDDAEFEFDGKKTAVRYNMVTLLKTLREKHVFKHGTRSKYIVRTDAGRQLGVHGVYGTFYGDWFPVKEDVALLHHYRNWEIDNDSEPRQRETIVVNRYNDTLIKSVRKVWSVIEEPRGG